ncbi:MAG TPA: N,N-dimethylformamidase beta subunit family domain-containing protein [Acidimicrobiales bacterium]|nr:N,N-dimethylformamidase beta subunit family domain-containing protein [Acidimicrobiales bacterium]
MSDEWGPGERAQGPAGRGPRQTRRRANLLAGLMFGVALLAVAALLAVTVLSSGTGQPPSSTTTSPGHSTNTTASPGTKGPGADGSRRSRGRGPRPPAPLQTFLGPYGVESSAILAENERPGTTSWRITHQAPSGFIEGFASTTYADAGQKVSLYVSTSARSFRVSAYRMGWYQGKGGRLVWTSPPIAGRVQPSCPVTLPTNMVSCDNWERSDVLEVTKAWPSGDYLLKLTGSGEQQGYVILTVWAPSSRATYLVMTRSLTEQAWNPYGGYDFYEGQGACQLDSDSYPPCNRARVVSFDRPYDWGDGAADFLGNEYPLVEWVEQHGLDVTYCTDITVSERPGILLEHKALLSLDHDEVWTNSERLAALAAAAKGVNIVFFGAAPVLRHARLEASSLGPDREEVDYRDSAEDPLDGSGNPMDVTGNTWSSPPSSWDETAFVGEEYSGYLLPNAPSAALVPYDASSWIFKGSGLTDRSAVPDVIASDIDHVDPSGPMPANLQVLAHSPVPLSSAYTNMGEWDGYTYSDMTYWSNPTSGSGVFDSGTVNWLTALVECSPAACPAPKIGRITGNLLRVFGEGPAGRAHPSVANWRSLAPSGS